LLCSPYEGWGYGVFWENFIGKIKAVYQLDDNDFVIFDGDYKKNPFVKNVTYNFWEEMNLEYFLESGISNLPNIRKNKFICLNRRPSVHRYALVTNLIDYKDQGILTLAGRNENKSKLEQSTITQFYNEFPYLANKFDREVSTSIPIRYYDGLDLEIDNPNWDDRIEKFHQSYLHIVTETHYSTECLYLSEKTFKPIIHSQPFVIFGNPGSIRLLKELGYQTFEKYIDESYDNETDIHLRLKKILGSIGSFIDKSPEKLTDMMLEMKPIFEHNIATLLRRQNEDIIVNLLSDLRRELYKR
jgi:hypothetical protein